MDTTRPRLTPEQALQFAPDASAAQNAQKLAKPGQWQILRCRPPVIWGEIQGSALYKAAFDLDTLEFKCSCPSRKQPCKHGLALVLSWAQGAERFEEAEPGGWVSEWLAKRQAAADKKSAKAAAGDEAAKPVDAAAQAKRLAAREKKVQGGMDELRIWLDDLLRGGLAHARTLSGSHFERMAGRLVDAQAAGLAALVQELAGALRLAHWQQAAPQALARLGLLLESHARQPSLPPEFQADVRTLIGWTVGQDEVLATPPLADDWLVLSHRDGDLDTGNGRFRRQWLWGRNSGRAALLLSFAFGGQNLNPPFPAGMTLPARLCWYPSATPSRALVQQHDAPQSLPLPATLGYATLADALDAQAAQLALNPLLHLLPWLLNAVIPVPADQGWVLRDSAGQAVPALVDDGWSLLALSGGLPLCVFGEWDGERLRVLDAWCDGEMLA
ncbi:MAG: SWIM zinc finger family protein [Fluviicoccus sp.]|uniref:SWIM zinc finger family protein n=1 Tax=Fluviicoccus sp. TaxID=2003552 RepID=UPI002727A26A|nr:SWIM zinc finger family protein [Fluviicoccus sp.]MDO8329626.1 SWIM zinc finger family protein [Fluviicoccus sp.]